jgi:hypothetical protein
MRSKRIPLTQGKTARVDLADYAGLRCHTWYAVYDGKHWYAYRKTTFPDGRRRSLSMHREIMGDPSGLLIDHRNDDGLDNRRGNLRIATVSQNKANCARYQTNASGYKGVYQAQGQKWQAQIRHQGKNYHLGTFSNPESAARAYDDGARRLHGVFARLNFPEP